MSNRILGILIILGFIGSGVIFYMYFFVYYMGSINIKSNLDNYKVSLYNKKLLKTDIYDCTKNICNINKISPFSYSLIISKSGYLDKSIDIKVGRNEIVNLDVRLDKKTVLSEVKSNDIKVNNINYKNINNKDNKISKSINNNRNKLETELSVKEKIDILKSKKQSYYYIDLGEIGIFYFKKEGNNLGLYKLKTRLGSFNIVDKQDIEITNILGTKLYIFIKIGKDKYIYDLSLKKRYLINLNISINYIKVGQNNNEFIINTIKGSFIYNKFTRKIEYFDFFRDFVYYKSGYIGIIDKTDTRRLINLGLKDITENLIIYYDTSSKEKKILYKTSLDIIKIYKIGENIMFISSGGKEYKLDNF